MFIFCKHFCGMLGEINSGTVKYVLSWQNMSSLDLRTKVLLRVRFLRTALHVFFYRTAANILHQRRLDD